MISSMGTIRQSFHEHTLSGISTLYIESPSPPRFLAGEKVPKADEGAIHEYVTCARTECDDYQSI